MNVDLTCPHCGVSQHARQLGGPWQIPPGLPWHYMVCGCHRKECGKPIFAIWEQTNDIIVQVYPFPQSSPEQIHKAIPEPIRKDWAEAKTCQYAGAYKGVVVMARRVMQQIAVDKGAATGKLHEQIDWMFKEGLITKSLHDAATEVRHFGNYGAHPQDDGLDEVSPESAAEVMHLTVEFLQDLYIQPHRTQSLRAKRAKSGGA